MSNLFIKDGRLKGWASNMLFCTGLAAMIGAFFFLRGWHLYLGLIAGLVIASISSFEAKAKVLGLRPFTNDPLGWRSAKASYEPKGEEQKIDRES